MTADDEEPWLDLMLSCSESWEECTTSIAPSRDDFSSLMRTGFGSVLMRWRSCKVVAPCHYSSTTGIRLVTRIRDAHAHTEAANSLVNPLGVFGSHEPARLDIYEDGWSFMIHSVIAGPLYDDDDADD